jgi:hypothetical protein
MSRTDTAVRVISASPGRVFAALADSDAFHTLSGLGVDYYQGWLFSPAVPATEFRNLLARGSLHVPDDA